MAKYVARGLTTPRIVISVILVVASCCSGAVDPDNGVGTSVATPTSSQQNSSTAFPTPTVNSTATNSSDIIDSDVRSLFPATPRLLPPVARWAVGAVSVFADPVVGGASAEWQLLGLVHVLPCVQRVAHGTKEAPEAVDLMASLAPIAPLAGPLVLIPGPMNDGVADAVGRPGQLGLPGVLLGLWLQLLAPWLVTAVIALRVHFRTTTTTEDSSAAAGPTTSSQQRRGGIVGPRAGGSSVLTTLVRSGLPAVPVRWNMVALAGTVAVSVAGLTDPDSSVGARVSGVAGLALAAYVAWSMRATAAATIARGAKVVASVWAVEGASGSALVQVLRPAERWHKPPPSTAGVVWVAGGRAAVETWREPEFARWYAGFHACRCVLAGLSVVFLPWLLPDEQCPVQIVACSAPVVITLAVLVVFRPHRNPARAAALLALVGASVPTVFVAQAATSVDGAAADGGRSEGVLLANDAFAVMWLLVSLLGNAFSRGQYDPPVVSSSSGRGGGDDDIDELLDAETDAYRLLQQELLARAIAPPPQPVPKERPAVDRFAVNPRLSPGGGGGSVSPPRPQQQSSPAFNVRSGHHLTLTGDVARIDDGDPMPRADGHSNWAGTRVPPPSSGRPEWLDRYHGPRGRARSVTAENAQRAFMLLPIDDDPDL